MSIAKSIRNRLSALIRGPEVRERVVVRHVDDKRRARCSPGFMIGAYRSGTTLLRFVLDSHPNIAVPPETNFLNGLAELWRNDWYQKGLQGVGVDEEGMLSRLRAFADGIYGDYTAAKGKQRWFDKTPSYIDILDFLDAAFGDECRYIMMYRHGLDVANSMAKMHGYDVSRGPGSRFAEMYPDSPYLTNTQYWVQQCEKMMEFEASHPGQCYRVRYEDYATDPERFLPPLFEFLGEEWDPSVLKFADKSHDYGLQDAKIMETNKFAANVGSYNAWAKEDIAKAMEIAAPTLDKLGYSD